MFTIKEINNSEIRYNWLMDNNSGPKSCSKFDGWIWCRDVIRPGLVGRGSAYNIISWHPGPSI